MVIEDGPASEAWPWPTAPLPRNPCPFDCCKQDETPGAKEHWYFHQSFLPKNVCGTLAFSPYFIYQLEQSFTMGLFFFSWLLSHHLQGKFVHQICVKYDIISYVIYHIKILVSQTSQHFSAFFLIIFLRCVAVLLFIQKKLRKKVQQFLVHC